MHEMSLCESMLRIIEKQAERDKFDAVRKVRIELGDLSGASEESLRFCFPVAAKDTIAKDAELEFIYSSGTALRIIEMDVL